MDKNVLTVSEIAEILQIKQNTIHSRKWQQKTGCPLKKIGKRVYVLTDDFWKWFKTSVRGSLKCHKDVKGKTR